MASPNSESGSSFFEQLIGSRNRDLSFFLPFLLGISNQQQEQDQEQDENQETGRTQDRIILINPFTQGMTIIESNRSFDALLNGISQKDGLPPATKSSIDEMPKVEITEKDLECAICLDGWEIGGEGREMPCKHKYHSNCIEKWLGIHGSCPICRYKMPVEEDGELKKRNDEEAEERRGDREIWVTFSFNRRDSNSTNLDSSSSSSHSEEESHE